MTVQKSRTQHSLFTQKFMTSVFRNVLLAVFAGVSVGCNALPAERLSSSIPIYATRTDAQAVAGGQFGAVPVEISSESRLEMVSAECGSVAVQVRSGSGRVGWVPASALPATCANRAMETQQAVGASKVD